MFGGSRLGICARLLHARITRHSSTLEGHMSSSRRAASDDGQRKRRREPPESDAVSVSRPRLQKKTTSSFVSSKGSVCKCARCKKLSSDKDWFDHRAQGSESVPHGDACRECGELHKDAFAHMTFHDWAKECTTDPTLKAQVDIATQVKRGETPSWLAAVLEKTTKEEVTVEHSCLVLSEAELCKVVKKARLPKRLKTVPMVEIPLDMAKCKARGVPAGTLETCFCFFF